jgi:translocation-and-assembly-module (TAM) inner membrane subunit TamB-like protein
VKLLQRLRAHKLLRPVTIVLTTVIALAAAALVAAVSIDLGPIARPYAERYGSKALDRPIHIGSLRIHLFTGKILVENLVIDGLRPGDRPFFTARQIAVGMDWRGAVALRPDLTIASVEMTDWAMLVEKWENRHNFPRFTRDEEPAKGPARFTTTMKQLRASRGRFSYEDHEAPWSIVCPNLDMTIVNRPQYHGTATFTGGTVAIQDYVPMWANMRAAFVLDGPRVHLERIDLDTDGATTVARGDVDLAHWPEQTYQVRSRVRFPRMREIFFKSESWALSGDGAFDGTFHLAPRGVRDLSGSFTSDLLGVYAYRFPSLYGSLRWTPTAFEIWDAGAGFYGGDARFTYSIKPLGAKGRPNSRFAFDADGIDLRRFTDFEQLAGLRFAGTASWQNALEWPLGRFHEHHGEGRIVVTPPAGVVPMTPSLAEARAADAEHTRHEWGPFAPIPLPQHLPIAGELAYRYGPDEVTLERGRFVTERTHVQFEGTTAWGERSRIPFHVVSRSWQESDQVLAGIITDFGSRTGAVAFGGRGEFDGVMTGAFRRPRVEGTFTGDDLRGFDTLWGSGTGHVVIENGYVDATNAVVSLDGSEIRVDGRFSLGYPRDDGGEEIDARFRVSRRDIDSLRHVFQIDEYPASGRLSGEFHLTGRYERPIGFGGMTIENGVAYGEPFERATAALRFDGTGVRLDNIAIAKDAGALTGAAFIGWDSSYSFNADARRIPIDRLTFLQYEGVPVSGVAEVTATGSGTFDVPRNDFRFRVSDLSVSEERVGQVSGTLAMRGADLSGQIDAASSRLAMTGTGRIALTPARDAEITFRFHDTSLDPYLRLFAPRLVPYASTTVSGSVRLVGALADVDRLVVDAAVDTVDIKLFDYAIRNAEPVHLTLDRRVVKIERLQLVGDLTRLSVAGAVDLKADRVAIQASGDANLGVLQGFFRDVRSSGRATLTAEVNGPLRRPLFSGSATIADGRIRHFSLPNALDAINGTVRFDGTGVRLDDLAATFGGGKVQFGGRIGFDGYAVTDLNITARGEEMRLRVPEGVRSVVNADLALTGPIQSPTLGGRIDVRSAIWNKRVDAPGSLFDLASRRGTASGAVPPPAEAAPSVPLKFDVELHMPSSLRVENNLARMVASADLTLRGTYDRPVVFGHADVERGEVSFEGRRYRITRGSMDFTNPNRIEPFFDVEAETNVRVPYQTYRVTVGLTGTSDQLRPAVNSDPPLPQADVLALLLSDVSQSSSAAFGATAMAPELRALQDPTQAQKDIVAARATRALSSPLSSEVGKVVEQTFGVDTFQLTPSFVDPYNTQTKGLNPTARVTIGKRISNRVYLTFSRSLNSGSVYNDQIVLLEIDQSDLVSWILSRNEDQQTYALEFRVRHVF